MKAKVFVTLKKGVLDPQGKTIQKALNTLGFKDIEDVRAGKYFELTLTKKSKKTAELDVKKMCEKLLANTVIEDYNFKIEA
ncbi:MAG: phosphoribosylformylglycinamidine synthase subunit PurS [Nitrospirae bacterium]|nr:phosphoribosylformylglycinamidine synthase subunit PurS [Nitrospirota bacterium]